nr:diguanylate cyclase [Shimia abyssi]
MTLALAVWGVIKAPAPVVDTILKQDSIAQSELWKRRVVMHLENAHGTFRNGTVTEADIAYLQLLPEASDVYRFKLFSSDGTVFWSTRPNDIGSVNSDPYFRTKIARGEAFYVQEAKPASEIDGLALHASNTSQEAIHEVAEVYRPIMENGRFLGAIEFYTDLTDIRDTMIARVQTTLAVLCALAVITMLLINILLMRANRAQYEALRGRTDQERKILDDQLRLAREVQLLGELNEWLQSSRSLDELFDMVARFMTHILPEAEGSVYVYSNSRDVLDGSASWNGGEHKDHIYPDGCWGLRRGRTYEFGSSEIDFVCEHAEPHDGRAYFCFPILAHGETVGLMHLRAINENCEGFHKSKKLAQMCAEQISMAIANVRMRDQLHEQSVRDSLTGLFNRRHMTDYLRKSITRCQNTGTTLSLIAIDVDHFKKFNDNYGHDAGDMVLRAVGSVLQQTCDRDEIACRPGGEEFTIILPETSQEDTLMRAEHLRQAVEAISVRYGEKTLPSVTISLGIAFYPAHGTMPQDLMRAADDALYDAKAKGRNQVCEADNAPMDDGARRLGPQPEQSNGAETKRPGESKPSSVSPSQAA